MSDEDRAHLSYDMTRCYVTKTMAGADLPRCPGSNSVEACMADVDEQMYTLYTLFYSNIDAVGSQACHVLALASCAAHVLTLYAC